MDKNKKHNEELIELFLAGKLNKEELAEFYKKLEKDDELAEEVANKSVKEYGRMELKKSLERIDEKINKSTIRLYPLITKIAAIIILVIGLGYLSIYLFKIKPGQVISKTEDSLKTLQPDSLKQLIDEERIADIKDLDTISSEKLKIAKPDEQLAEKKHKKLKEEDVGIIKSTEILLAENYSPYEITGKRGFNEELNKAIKFYNSGQYDSAVVRFEKLLKNPINNENIDFILFYLANSYLALAFTGNEEEELKKAQEYFEFLINDMENEYIEQSKWYLSLTYLKSGEKEKCKEILNQIIKNKSYNYKNAAALLENIN